MKPSTCPTPADSAARPVPEAARLEAQRSYPVLDSDPEPAFTDIARLAALVCGTPIALVALVDGERQWFKVRVGPNVPETPREHAFCQYAMRAPDVYEVRDAATDARFAPNPLVPGDLSIRFYAGAPLLSPDGQPLGTLCALDTVPRALTDAQRDALRILARQTTAHLELRRGRLRLEDERQHLAGALRMAAHAGEAPPANHRTEIFVKQDQRLVRIATADLQYAEALGDYVTLHTTREQYTVYGTMKDLETKLPARDFARVHRKYIVRLDRLVAIEADAALLDGGPGRDPVRVAIGSSYKAGLLGRLNLV